MKLVGFNFSKINVEKSLSKRPKDLKLNTDIEILNIENAKADIFKSKEEIVVINFKYVIDYSPSYAKINFEGNILLSLDPKISKTLLKDWKKKKISSNLRAPLYNLIMTKSNIRALQLEEEMNLPYHIPFPLIKPEDFKEKDK